MSIVLFLVAIVLAVLSIIDGRRALAIDPSAAGDEAAVAAAETIRRRRLVSAGVTAVGAIAALGLALTGGW
ncbi:MAG: hypothetical protein ACTHN0_15860 [Aquihabitans sp.]